MAKEYLEILSALMKQAVSTEFKDIKLECRHFFSGAAVYANGKICISLTPVGFAVKLPEASRNALIKQHGAELLRYFPNGPIKKDYVVLPEGMLKDRKALQHWVSVSIAHALSRSP